MAQKFEHYTNIAGMMIDADRQRDKAFAYYQKMRRIDWEIPEPADAIPGIRKVVDTGPSDAISKSVQVMASRPPRLKMMPAIANPEGRTRANMIERVLKWQLTNADRRRPRGVVADVFESAAMYDAVCLNIMDLEHQMKVVGESPKLKRARRYGRFVINTFNPRDVHVRRSSYGVESVLLCQQRKAHEVIAEYPAAEKSLRDLADKDADVLFNYYMDYDATCVWVNGDGIGDKPILAPADHDLPFMYWVALMGGTTLDAQEEHKYRPILYPVYRSGEWETKNVVDTMMTSDVIWKALAPVIAVEGAMDDVTYDTGDPGRRVMNLPVGAAARPLPPQQVDPGLFSISQDFRARMEDSTGIASLAGEGVSGESFAALNLRTQTALGSLKPAKELAEKALAEMFTQMLLWVSYTEIDLTAYNDNRRSEQYGEEYIIEADTIDEENIYISVELDPDEPTDKIQRTNTATMMKQLGFSNASSLETLGVEDPEAELDKAFEERMFENEEQLHIQRGQMAIQQEAQQAQEQQAMEAQQLAQQAQQAPAIPGGEGFNPNSGGVPPALAFPEATREGGAGEFLGTGEGL